jgi:hypothetical protein
VLLFTYNGSTSQLSLNPPHLLGTASPQDCPVFNIATMLSATRRWFQRNRTPIAIGVGVVGAGYLATQYVISKINDARERMSSDRIAKEK